MPRSLSGAARGQCEHLLLLVLCQNHRRGLSICWEGGGRAKMGPVKEGMEAGGCQGCTERGVGLGTAWGTPGDGGRDKPIPNGWPVNNSGSCWAKHPPCQGSGYPEGLADAHRVFFPLGAVAEAGVATGLPGPPLCVPRHPGDLLPPPLTHLTMLSLFPVQWTPLLPLPSAGPYARPTGGVIPAAPQLGQGHLWSLPERDGCAGGTDKAGG